MTYPLGFQTTLGCRTAATKPGWNPSISEKWGRGDHRHVLWGRVEQAVAALTSSSGSESCSLALIFGHGAVSITVVTGLPGASRARVLVSLVILRRFGSTVHGRQFFNGGILDQ